jgi:thioesterase domain-containing protein/acyl carrier protein
MGRGYLHQPALTQEKFIPHLFHTQTTERLYRTGDLARYLEDGSIDFLGRMDHQVKIRGFRIELGEIETVLQQIAEIKQAVVIDREDTLGDRRLVAYMISNENPPTFQALRTALKEKLPEYMIPAAFVFLTAFKLTPNGKIDRKALPVPDMSQNTIATDSQTQPSEIMHYQLLNIWEELLNVSPISINDNFFDLGGHSLLAARMIARIEQVFGKKIALSTLFAGPTIEALTRVLTQQTQTHPKTPLIAVQVTGSGSKKPFFFLHGDWSGGAYYCFKLSRKAGLDQPFYVLEPTIFPESAEIPTIEGQAAAHLELVRSVQPQGPYYLGGYCNGSIIAYEMAQQLQAQGEQVNFLAMIDPPFDDHIKKLAQLCTRTLRLKERQLWKTYLYTRHIYIRKIRPLLVRLAKATDEQLLKSINVSIEKDPAFTRLLPPMNTLRTDYTSIFAWALQYYTRQPYHGKATFIWASEQLAEEPNNPWNEHVQVSEAESHIIAGTHYSILTDEIDALATCLGTALQQAQAQNGDDPIL